MSSYNESKEIIDRRVWKEVSLQERIAYLEDIYVKHPAVQAILSYIERELEYRRADGKTTGLLIIAPSGAGKSALIKHLTRSYPKVETEESRTCPVVAFTVPTVPSPKTMGAALLRAMADILWDVGTAGKKFDRINKLLTPAKTRLILIDNFQDIPTRRKSRGILNVATWVRDLCDINFGGIVIALGTAESSKVRDANEQVQRRLKAKLSLPVFAGNSDDELKNFARLLKSIEKLLPLAENSAIYSVGMTKRMHCATMGNFDYLMTLLKNAICIAEKHGQETLTMQTLHDAFAHGHGDYAASENPFSPEFLWTNLDQPGQVFHNARFSTDIEEELEAA